jgi:SIR2-like protein
MIPLIPAIPDELREAAQIGRLVPFVGAGASVLGGCPGYLPFADRCLDAFVQQGKVSYAQLDQMRELPPRIKLSIALALQEQHGLKIDYRQVLHPNGCVDVKGRRLYSALTRLGNAFVTTNYDEWLDDVIAPAVSAVSGAGPDPTTVPAPRTVYFRVPDLTAAHLNERNVVIHLHGSIKDPAGMIMTTRHYIQHYANDRKGGAAEENLVLTFLDDLFRNKTVLFIGYGLSELEILEYVVLKTKGLVSSVSSPRHFALQGYFSHQYDLMMSIKQYYHECGINLLPFLLDTKGYDQLIEVTENFATGLPASEPMLAQELVEMEGFLNG